MLYVMLVGAYPFERPEDKHDNQKLQKMIQVQARRLELLLLLMALFCMLDAYPFFEARIPPSYLIQSHPTQSNPIPIHPTAHPPRRLPHPLPREALGRLQGPPEEGVCGGGRLVFVCVCVCGMFWTVSVLLKLAEAAPGERFKASHLPLPPLQPHPQPDPSTHAPLPKKVLVADPAKRLTIDGIYNHPWYTKNLPPGVREMNERPQPPPEGLQTKEEIARIVTVGGVCVWGGGLPEGWG
jgi:hypothetical protein